MRVECKTSSYYHKRPAHIVLREAEAFAEAGFRMVEVGGKGREASQGNTSRRKFNSCY